MATTTTSIILDIRRVKRNGKFPLKLRVTNQRITRDYLTVFELSESDYKRLSGHKVSAELQKLSMAFVETLPTSAWGNRERIYSGMGVTP